MRVKSKLHYMNLNRLAKKYEILPEGTNLSFEIVRGFLTARHFFENSVPRCWPCHLNTTKSEKSKKYNKSKFTLKKTTSLHSLHDLQSAQSAVCSLHFNVTALAPSLVIQKMGLGIRESSGHISPG